MATKQSTQKNGQRPGRKPGTKMTDEHKAALAAGRESGRAVRAYLQALEDHRPRRGRKRTPESIQARLAKIDDQLAGADPVKRLNLVQERLDLIAEQDALSQTTDLAALEQDFRKHAKAYSQNKGITYAAWREVGVPADILKAAGITR